MTVPRHGHGGRGSLGIGDPSRLPPWISLLGDLIRLLGLLSYLLDHRRRVAQKREPYGLGRDAGRDIIRRLPPTMRALLGRKEPVPVRLVGQRIGALTVEGAPHGQVAIGPAFTDGQGYFAAVV